MDNQVEGDRVGADVLSPSKITDYFSQRSSPLNDSLKIEKDSCDKNLSVYPTPDSSPAKESEEVKESLTNMEDLSKSATELSTVKDGDEKAKVNEQALADNLLETKIECSPEKVSKTDDLCKSATRKEVDESKRSLFVSDLPKRKSSQHRICQVKDSSTTITKKSDESPEDNISGGKQADCVRPVVKSPPSPPNASKSRSRKQKSVKCGSEQPASQPTQCTTPKPKPRRRKKTEPVQTSTITDYFPVRRSGRQTRSQIEKETKHQLEEQIKCKCEDGLQIKEFEGKGRGIMATKAFDRGDFVIEYAGDLIDVDLAKKRESKYAETPSVGCYMYFFNHKNKQYCVDATSESGRLGRLINHSRDGNCSTKVVTIGNTPHLILVAARDIVVGEELSYDYGDRSKLSLEAHPWLKL